MDLNLKLQSVARNNASQIMTFVSDKSLNDFVTKYWSKIEPELKKLNTQPVNKSTEYLENLYALYEKLKLLFNDSQVNTILDTLTPEEESNINSEWATLSTEIPALSPNIDKVVYLRLRTIADKTQVNNVITKLSKGDENIINTHWKLLGPELNTLVDKGNMLLFIRLRTIRISEDDKGVVQNVNAIITALSENEKTFTIDDWDKISAELKKVTDKSTTSIIFHIQLLYKFNTINQPYGIINKLDKSEQVFVNEQWANIEPVLKDIDPNSIHAYIKNSYGLFNELRKSIQKPGEVIRGLTAIEVFFAFAHWTSIEPSTLTNATPADIIDFLKKLFSARQTLHNKLAKTNVTTAIVAYIPNGDIPYWNKHTEEMNVIISKLVDIPRDEVYSVFNLYPVLLAKLNNAGIQNALTLLVTLTPQYVEVALMCWEYLNIQINPGFTIQQFMDALTNSMNELLSKYFEPYVIDVAKMLRALKPFEKICSIIHWAYIGPEIDRNYKSKAERLRQQKLTKFTPNKDVQIRTYIDSVAKIYGKLPPVVSSTIIERLSIKSAVFWEQHLDMLNFIVEHNNKAEYLELIKNEIPILYGKLTRSPVLDKIVANLKWAAVKSLWSTRPDVLNSIIKQLGQVPEDKVLDEFEKYKELLNYLRPQKNAFDIVQTINPTWLDFALKRWSEVESKLTDNITSGQFMNLLFNIDVEEKRIYTTGNENFLATRQLDFRGKLVPGTLRNTDEDTDYKYLSERLQWLKDAIQRRFAYEEQFKSELIVEFKHAIGGIHMVGEKAGPQAYAKLSSDVKELDDLVKELDEGGLLGSESYKAAPENIMTAVNQSGGRKSTRRVTASKFRRKG
jgi:hypothetical protein